MLNVQKYLRTEGNSLETLHEEFGIVVKEYSDLVVLNYNQIDSPRFHYIADECRGLILEKGTWDIVARSFKRFYNLGEGHDKGAGSIRLTNFDDDTHQVIPFDLSRASIVEKRDGSLITAYWYNNKWNFSTRGMAHAEGETNYGLSFAELIKSATNYRDVLNLLNSFYKAEKNSWVFELTSPANRVVTPYNETELTLLASVHKETGIEISPRKLAEIATNNNIPSPYFVETDSWEDLVKLVEDLPSMEEGMVLVVDDDCLNSPIRIKVKNSKFVAIAHMRQNGTLSPKNVLTLIMEDETEEYLSYFPEDKKYFDIVEKIYQEFIWDIGRIYASFHHLEDQKDFAITIQKHVTNKSQCGFLFKMRKGIDLTEALQDMGPKKLSKALGLKAIFAKEFGLVVDEED